MLRIIVITSFLCVFGIWYFEIGDQNVQTSQTPAQPSVVNIADKPLYIKDLTTGVPYDFKKLPKPSYDKNQSIYIDYQYFGDMRKVSINLNKKIKYIKLKYR